jgi:hypothetical protein
LPISVKHKNQSIIFRSDRQSQLPVYRPQRNSRTVRRRRGA